ncbi:MAG: class I SAM-dependent methyltransferase [Ruminococcus sp.]|nr:class I SAM-dependent methyltransferase [Ruminococcus sp.]
MIWDKVSGIYDVFEKAINGKVFNELGRRTAEYIESGDIVLECACGTGAISEAIAQKCRKLVATDLSSNMMSQAEKKCSIYGNTVFRKADMTALNCRDERFDKVVAGNVIHLLDEPQKAVSEMLRVCKKGGKVIIPTYINKSEKTNKLLVKLCEMAGVKFKREFTLDSYMDFFKDMGLNDVEFFVIEGHMPCAVAVVSV